MNVFYAYFWHCFWIKYAISIPDTPAPMVKTLSLRLLGSRKVMSGIWYAAAGSLKSLRAAEPLLVIPEMSGAIFVSAIQTLGQRETGKLLMGKQ